MLQMLLWPSSIKIKSSNMKYRALLIFFSVIFLKSYSQDMVFTTPATLQIYTMKPDGAQVVITSLQLSVSYNNLKMTGELMLNSLGTDDDDVKMMLDSAAYDKFTFTAVIPEGQFVFQSTLNSKFSVETDISYGDQQGRIMMDFDVSNRNTSLANTFDITCTGSVSLSNDLGIQKDIGLADKISFQFFQNVTARNY
jgi:hypothetical protein